jgi:subtilisin family serine protease
MNSNLQKLDPDLLARLQESKTQRIPAFITTKENLNSLRSLGFELQMTLGNIAVIAANLEEFEKIAELDDVLRIEMPQSHSPGLDTSTKQVGADQIRTISGNTWSGIATGKGVIAAIIDSGINYEHKSFRNTDGTTRVIGILDFSLNNGPTAHPDGGRQPNITVTFGAEQVVINQGVEYTSEKIRDALAPGGTKLRHKDTDGHGTHVAGIAAGNGFQRDHCGHFYPGVAPEADILVIKLGKDNLENEIIHGVAYAIHIAIQEQKAVVINISSSRESAGARDGNSVLELALDFMLDNHASNKNVSLVTIAGNNADKNTHATASVAPGDTVTVNFKIPNTAQPKIIEVWYSSANNNQLGCRIRPPFPLNATGEVLPQPTPARLRFPLGAGGQAEIGSSLRNNLQFIHAVVIPPKPQGFEQQIAVDEWRLDLRNVAAAGPPIEFHAWVTFIDAVKPSAQFRSHTSKASTVGIPGSARNVITVGSFKEGDGLSDFSGQGPTFDNRRKPDITAPGEDISAADSDLPGCCREFWCRCCDVFHIDHDGTSQAAPHVTGAIALMLELNDGLTRVQVRDFLLDNARRDGETGPNPSNQWGAGKLNVAAAVNAVNATLPVPRTLAVAPVDPDSPSTEHVFLSRATGLELQERFMNSPGGRFYYALAEKYFDEVKRLINENKKVATIWHRNDGPLMLRLGLRALAKPDDPLPRKVNDITIRERLIRIANIIKRFATDALAAEIDLHLSVLFQMEGRSVNQILSFLESENELVNIHAQSSGNN